MLTPVLVLLTACAAHPPFRKLDEGVGYTVKESPIPQILDLRLELPEKTKEEYRLDYAGRAAGEECFARHYLYFDFGLLKDGNARAFCFPKEQGPNLGTSFGMVAAPHGDPMLRVTDTSASKRSPLSPWDVVRKIGDRKVHDLGELKEALFLLGRKGEKSVSVHIERSDIPLVFEIPIV